MKIRCLLVDDERLALALLEHYLSRTPGLELTGACRSPIQAVEILQKEEIDLLFLDIQMPLLSGIHLLKAISCKPVTIFTTAYAQHAAEAFDLDAADYLLKPFSFERFEHAVEKARAMLDARLGKQDAMLPQGAITVKCDRKWVRIPLEDIVYVEGWKEYVKIYTPEQRYITLESMRHLESVLPASHFRRVHKSFIVAQRHIQSFDGDQLILPGAVRVPVARSRKKDVLESIFGASGP